MQNIMVNNCYFSQNIVGKGLDIGALSEFQNQSSIKNSRLIKGLIGKSYLSDHLARIEQRVGSALNLVWLNTNDTFFDKNLHRTKREDPVDLELREQDVLEDCITAISNEDFRQAGKICHDLMILDHGEAALRRIIERVYRGNVCNFDKLERFILEGLNSVGSKLVACQLLLAEIIKNDQLFTPESLRLAYNFRRLMRHGNYLKLTPEFKLFFESEKSKFPQAVKHLLSNGFCLKSVAHNNEYLYAAWFKMPNNRDNRVFTWIPGKYAGEEAVWRVESSDNGKTFYIYNAKQHAYLNAIKDQYDDDRRYVIGLQVRGTQSKWRIQLVAESEIILLNDYYGETFYNSFKYDDNRRYVFTWLKGPIRSARWKVEACGSSTRQRRDTPDDGLENADNNAAITLPDKPVTNLVFFQIKQQSNGNNKTLVEPISDLNREMIEQSTPSRLNRTVP